MSLVVHTCDPECVAHLGEVKTWENIPGVCLVETDCTCDEAEAIDGVDCAHDADMVFSELATQAIQFEGPNYGEASDNIGLAMLSSSTRLPNVWPAVYQYAYDKTGAGVLVYQIDGKAGYASFPGNVADLAGRIEVIYDAHPSAGPGDHGTAVAGIIAGKRFGVAKDARIKNAAATGANGQGSLSQIIGAINACIGHYAGRTEPAVINMSIAGEAGSNPMAAAIAAARDAGLLICAGAGNASKDAGTTWPAADPRALTAGGMDWQENISGISNYGPAVDLFALGENVSVDGYTRHGWLGGTSAASPFVAGIAARLLQGRSRLDASGVDAFKAEIIAMGKPGRATVPAGTTSRVANIPGVGYATGAQLRVTISA